MRVFAIVAGGLFHIHYGYGAVVFAITRLRQVHVGGIFLYRQRGRSHCHGRHVCRNLRHRQIGFAHADRLVGIIKTASGIHMHIVIECVGSRLRQRIDRIGVFLGFCRNGFDALKVS